MTGASLALALVGAGRGRRPRAPVPGAADPRQPDRAPPVARAVPTDAARGGRRSAAHRLAARRRPARPADRVVVLHRPPARDRRRRRRAALRLRVRHLPGRARRVPAGLGLAPGHHRRDRRRLPLRPAPGGRAAGRPLAARRRPASRSASTCRSPASTRPTRRRIGRSPWTMAGDAGLDGLGRGGRPGRGRDGRASSGLGLDLAAAARRKPPALHDEDGWIDFGPAGGSYYYSRTAMTATGTLDVGPDAIPVEGIAWFDHQWGDFISVGGGGWDWFAVNLEDGTDLTLSLVRDADGTLPARVRHARRRRRRDPPPARGRVHASTSPTAGRARRPAPTTRPAGGSTSPAEDLVIDLRPTVADQELDTRATTGRHLLGGLAGRRRPRAPACRSAARRYVELTGYAPTARPSGPRAGVGGTGAARGRRPAAAGQGRASASRAARPRAGPDHRAGGRDVRARVAERRRQALAGRRSRPRRRASPG